MSATSPRATIVIPTHDRPRLLERAGAEWVGLVAVILMWLVSVVLMLFVFFLVAGRVAYVPQGVSTVFPFTASVISEADAREIAHPEIGRRILQRRRRLGLDFDAAQERDDGVARLRPDLRPAIRDRAALPERAF